MAWPGGCSLLQASEHPSDVAASSWSDIVEETPDPQGKFWLSSRQLVNMLDRVVTGSKDPNALLVQSLWEAISSESGGREQTPA